MVTNDTGVESLCESEEELPASAVLTNYEPMLLTAASGAGSAREGFRKGSVPDSCADDVRGREASLCFPGHLGSVVPTTIKACLRQ